MFNMGQNLLLACDQVFGGLDMKRSLKAHCVYVCITTPKDGFNCLNQEILLKLIFNHKSFMWLSFNNSMDMLGFIEPDA